MNHKPGRALIGVMLVSLNLTGPLLAENLPRYSAVQKELQQLWEKRYPIKIEKFIANPQKKGILKIVHKKETAYYYHFQGVIKIPYRDEQLEIKTIKERTLEIWVRYRPALSEQYDITFAQEYLLPGKNRRWLKAAFKSRPEPRHTVAVNNSFYRLN